jgi:hypothetical protein
VETANRQNGIFLDADADRVLILSGGHPGSYDEAAGADIAFYVSGAVGGRTEISAGALAITSSVSLFGGDVVTSGSLTVLGGQPGGTISGSIHLTDEGLSYLCGTGGISIFSGTNGQVIISGSVDTAGSGGGSARSVAGDTDNGVITWVTSDNTFAAEANLTFDGTDSLIAAAGKVQIRDTGLFINSSHDGHLQISSDGILALTGSSRVDTDSPVTASAGVNVDADGLGLFQGGAGNDLLIGVVSDDAYISNMTSDKDIIFRVNDGGAPNTEVMRVNGDTSNLAMATNKKITFDGVTSITEYISGDGNDVTIGSSAYINIAATGLSFTSQATLISLDSGNNAALTIEDGEGGNAMLTFDTNGGVGIVADVLVGASDATAGQYTLSPAADNVTDLGSPSKRWRNIYTGDLHLANERGNWTVVEESDYLTLRNNKTGKRFKILMEMLPDDGG